MPAMRETPRTSPFLRLLLRMRESGVALEKYMVPTAMAVRTVWALAETLTMCADPEAVRWGRAGCVAAGDVEDLVMEAGSVVDSSSLSLVGMAGEDCGSSGGREEVE